MFYNEQKKHVRAKKEILDDSGNVRKGCKIVKNGEVYERTLFTAKNKLFKQEHYLDEAKRFYTDLINLLIEDDKNKHHVFDRNGLYLATKKIGKNNPKAEHIKVLTAARKLKNTLFHEALEKEYGNKAVIKAEDTADIVTAPAKKTITEPELPVSPITATFPEAEVVEQPKPQIPPRPVMPPEAAAFPRLQKVKVTLDKHNHLIFEAERERNMLEIELSDLNGFARLTKKKELESRIATKTEEIRTLKAGLSGIARQHGFATVQDFYTAFYTAQRSIEAYQKECAKWEEAYGEKATPKAETMHDKIQRYQEKANIQNANHSYQSRDKGAR